MRKTRRAGAKAWIQSSAKGTNPIGLLRTFQHARNPTHLWRESSDAGLLAKKKTKAIRTWKRRSCRPNPKMCWKPMKCGHLSTKDGTNAGFGRSCVVGLARSWRLSSGIAARRLVAGCGSRFHQPTRVATVTAISGKPINSFFLKRHTSALAKTVDKQTTWSVGITP